MHVTRGEVSVTDEFKPKNGQPHTPSVRATHVRPWNPKSWLTHSGGYGPLSRFGSIIAHDENPDTGFAIE